MALIFGLLHPEHYPRNQLQKVELARGLHKRHCVECEGEEIEGKLGGQLVRLHVLPLLHHLPLPVGVVPSEETQRHV